MISTCETTTRWRWTVRTVSTTRVTQGAWTLQSNCPRKRGGSRSSWLTPSQQFSTSHQTMSTWESSNTQFTSKKLMMVSTTLPDATTCSHNLPPFVRCNLILWRFCDSLKYSLMIQLHIHCFSAPAHEHHVIELHKHGNKLGGLPMIFWVSIGSLIVIFHVFLFKMIWQEYCSGAPEKYRTR